MFTQTLLSKPSIIQVIVQTVFFYKQSFGNTAPG